MKNSPLKYNGEISSEIGDNNVTSPIGTNAQPIPCNKTRIEVCKNSLHLRWGMEIRINDQRPTSTGPDTPVVIESITYSGTPGDITANIQLSHNIDDDLSIGSAVTFHGDRNLNFHPDRKITGLNVIDGMIYWTDNHSEPKKVNIERSKEGSKSWKYGAGWDGSLASIDPYTWPGCQGGEDIACYSDFDQHTKLIIEGEHVMDCENSTSTCYIYGCTDMTATNYNPQANYDDGSCIIPTPVVYGCDDGTFGVNNAGACNSGMTYWSASATGNINGDYNTNDTNLCVFPDDCEICEVDSVTGLNTGSVIFDPDCGGCNDPLATNYSGAPEDCQAVTNGSDISCCTFCLDPTATNYYGSTNTYDCAGTMNGNDYSCCNYTSVSIDGCTDPSALNYDPNATNDDGSCSYCVFGCTAPSAFNYDPTATCGTGQWSNSNPTGCYPFVYGCTDPTALNYITPTGNLMVDVNTDDGSCILPPPTADCTPIDGGGNIEIADATGINGEPWNGTYPYVRHCPQNWIRPCEIVMSHPDFTDANGNTYQTQTMQGDDWVKTNEMTSVISPNNHALFGAVNGHERLVHWRMAIRGTNSVQNTINRYFLEALTKEFNAGNLDAGSTLMQWNWGNDPAGLPTQTQATDGIAGKVSLGGNTIKSNLVRAVGGYYTKVFYNFQEIITFFNGLTAYNGQPVLANPLTLANNILDLHETSNSGGPVSTAPFIFNNTGHINPLDGSATNISSFSYMMSSCGHDATPNWLTPSIETCENGVNKNEYDGISNAYLHTLIHNNNLGGILP